LLADRLLVFVEREVRANKKDARGGTFRVPTDQRTTIRVDQPMRLELPEKVARGLKIPRGTALPIVAQQIQGGVAQFGEVPASEG